MKPTMTKEELLDHIADFTFQFNHIFLLEIHGERHAGKRFVWSNPEYPGGTNEIWEVEDFKDYKLDRHGFLGRDKGLHFVKDYIDDVESLVLLDSSKDIAAG